MKTEEWTDFSVKLGGAGVKIIYASFQDSFPQQSVAGALAGFPGGYPIVKPHILWRFSWGK